MMRVFNIINVEYETSHVNTETLKKPRDIK